MMFSDPKTKEENRKKIESNDQEYWNKSLIFNIKKNRFHLKKKQTIMVDFDVFECQSITWRPTGESRKKQYLIDRTDRWTDYTPQTLEEAGYRRVRGLYDGFIWRKCTTYLRINGAHKFDVSTAIDDTGNPLLSLDTSATLNDFLHSTATESFIKGMVKKEMSKTDLQKMIFIAIIGAGALVGMHFLGVF